ncbi:MAG: DUF5689 domain-containing protein [Bacteroidales bacterium]|nr:DUF5689 domain-containing protein [Bacteroidales bacterium]
MKNSILKFLVPVSLAVAMLCACEPEAEIRPLDEVGCEEPVFATDYAAGSHDFKIFANGEFTAAIPDDCVWLHFKDAPQAKTVTLSGDVMLGLDYDINRSIIRECIVTLRRGSNTQTISITQDGLLGGGLSVEDKCISAPAEGGYLYSKVLTLINPEDLTYKVVYKEEGVTGWISSPVKQNNFIVFGVDENTSADLTRHAEINILSEGVVLGVIYVAQYPEGGSVQKVDIPTFKGIFYKHRTETVEEHIAVSGVVINDNAHGNGGPNRNTSVNVQDTDMSSRVIYLQTEDGTSGIKVIFKEDATMLTDLYDRITIDTYGLQVAHTDDPEVFEISGAALTAAVESHAGEKVEPREKSISELTDDDINTLITVKDVEIPIRKGPFTPLDTRYVTMVNVVPTVIRDKEGNDMYMLVNTACDFARDGQIMPQGSGDITGVLVHEYCDNYEWDKKKQTELQTEGRLLEYITGIGPIGRYQIRPFSREDIDLAESIEDSFSALLCEWRYLNIEGEHMIKNFDGPSKMLYATYPEVQDPMTLPYKFYITNSESKVGVDSLATYNDFTHLGPYTFGGQIDKKYNLLGNGVYDANGNNAIWDEAWMATVQTSGCLYMTNGGAWRASGWNSKTKYWTIEFPTTGLTSANYPLSIQLGVCNDTNGPGAPRYWVMQWSEDGQTWNDVRTYSIPDFPSMSKRDVWQFPGHKYITVNLPQETLGLDKVLVRMMPDPARLCAGNATSYDEGTISSGRSSAINYIGVRYNK